MSARACENRTGYGLQRHYLVDAVQLDRFLWHAENDAGGFVLRDGDGAGLFHFQHAPRTVVAHSSQDYADNIPAGITCRGAKQNIDGGAMAADQGTLLYFNVVTGSAALEQKMMMPGVSAGSVSSRVFSASVPPVDAPMTTTFSVVSAIA